MPIYGKTDACNPNAFARGSGYTAPLRPIDSATSVINLNSWDESFYCPSPFLSLPRCKLLCTVIRAIKSSKLKLFYNSKTSNLKLLWLSKTSTLKCWTKWSACACALIFTQTLRMHQQGPMPYKHFFPRVVFLRSFSTLNTWTIGSLHSMHQTMTNRKPGAGFDVCNTLYHSTP